MIITTSNLGKRFNREWIFKGLTQEFSKGNIYAITGPNGSGKSTLMQVLWGQAPPSEGTINYYSVDRKEIQVEDVFQHIAIATPYQDLIEEFTLLEQVEFHFRFKKPGFDFRMDEMITRMQLEASVDKPIRQFSSGMKQRLKLGLAMFSDCQVVFLDEPSTNLDEPSTNWYMTNLLKIKAQRLVLIATNQPADYPEDAHVLNLTDLKPLHKQVTKP
jgi:ABC-type multidrug transport system ATPase subunit